MFWGVVICDLTFIAVAYITNENNADMLLAGYNTMSKKEKESFDYDYLSLCTKGTFEYFLDF